MRKRRRLANKMTIMICAVLIAVSAFFYAPMNVHAQSVSEGQVLYSDNLVDAGIMPLASGANVTGSVTSGYYAPFNIDDYDFDFSPYFTQGEGLYKVSFSFNVTLTCNTSKAPFWVTPTSHFGFTETGAFSQSSLINSGGNKATVTYPCERVLYTTLDDTSLTVKHRGALVWSSSVGSPGSSFKVTSSYQVSNIVVEKVTVSDSEDYQNGYNAGYSAGEQAGYGSGYSQGFTDGEASVDTDAIYDEAFQAGKDSVDTESYYDAGYQAGYNAAYQEGYESGYSEGYQSAMDRIDGWGADTSDYPILLTSVDDYSSTISGSVKTSYPLQYEFSSDWKSTVDYNPFHTYKVVLNFVYDFDSNLSSDVYVLEDALWTFDIGSLSYNINPGSNVTNVFFIPGDRIGTSYSFTWHPILAIYGDVMTSDGVYCDYTVTFDIYDMGPSGDTQNHIANQTDSLTNGFDNSQGNIVNSDLSSGLNEYQTSENTLWATATTGLKDFTFFDFASVPAMITGMSFITAIMGSWFNQAGGASGVGIVLSILFSVILVAMVLGLYRWYQSRGGKE